MLTKRGGWCKSILIPHFYWITNRLVATCNRMVNLYYHVTHLDLGICQCLRNVVDGPSRDIPFNEKFEPFSQNELHRLRDYLSYGGFLLVDDNSAKAHSDFDSSVRGMIDELFPQIPLQKISRDHSVFRSFYLINRVTGRIQINPYLEGINVKGRTVLIYSTNDLGGAWARDKLGQWTHDTIGGATGKDS